METMRSKLILEYNGVDVTDAIADSCNSFTWNDNASGTSDTFSMNLDNIDQKWMNGFYPSDDDTFKAWIQLQEWAADYKQGKLYCGCFMIDSLQYRGFPETLELSGISTPINSAFNVKQKSRTWSKTTLQTILSDIAKDAGINLVFDAEDIRIDSANQTGKTDLAFACSMCSEYGLSIKLYNKKMVVYDQNVYERKAARYEITHGQLGGSDTYKITKQATSLYDSVKIQYTDGKTGGTLTYVYTIPGKAGNRQMILTTKAESYADAEKKAKAALRENVRESRKITLKMMGSAKYMAADCFNLSGFGKLDGKYFIESVTHQKAGGQYTVSLTAHLAVTDF
ncbi:MAG: contractile injection system protein, VgrG/Pvc8 family [Candidatus Gastranaerophilales bacterium]|nr:contractile injection system protein, VgrG/Pvc8 family [Candidatus Gastranaerophilales bacterium]